MNFLHGTNLQYYYLEATIREYMAVVMEPPHKQRMGKLGTIMFEKRENLILKMALSDREEEPVDTVGNSPLEQENLE